MSETAEQAMTEALHRMGALDCGPDADDYSDEAEHRINAHDLLDNLRAHGWRLVRGESPLDAFASALGRLGGPAAE